MNNQRRKAIEKLAERLDELKSEFEAIMDEEQEAFDNMPESLQYSERGERMEGIISNMEDVLSNTSASMKLSFRTSSTKNNLMRGTKESWNPSLCSLALP